MNIDHLISIHRYKFEILKHTQPSSDFSNFCIEIAFFESSGTFEWPKDFESRTRKEKFEKKLRLSTNAKGVTLNYFPAVI